MNKILRISLALALSSLGVFATFSPAQAHSDELKTSPEAGSTVEAGLIPVELQFGEPLMVMADSAASNEIIVVNAAGEPVAMSKCSEAKDSTLSATAMIADAGTYTVNWRAVSEDGHPVEGTFDFKVENTTGYTAETMAVACATPMPLIAPAPEARDANTDDASAQWPIFASIAFVVLAGGVGAAVMVRAKRRK